MRFDFIQVKLSFPLHDTSEGEGKTNTPNPYKGLLYFLFLTIYFIPTVFFYGIKWFSPVFYHLRISFRLTLPHDNLFQEKVNNHQKFFIMKSIL